MTRPTRRPPASHANAAHRMQTAPGTWIHITTHPARYSAQNTAARIRTAQYEAYAPAGAYEARIQPTETETAVYARYIGAAAQNGSTE
ncbi:hypothetical protein [Streptomyces lydicamycinicus]|uniref:hypothetical protein n=1 Tax=Streptomyces lydicamycinicus TaxID=1546107 RepID=UPI003C2DE3FD